MSVISQLKSLLPSGLRYRWHRLKLYLSFFRRGGRIKWNSDLGAFVAGKSLPSFRGAEPVEVVIRSGREFRRWIHFGESSEDMLHDWLVHIGPAETLWDIGSANGLEGCCALQLTGCHVVFVEPFTPSIETILKSLVVADRKAKTPLRYDVVQAAVSDSPSFGRFIMHTLPVPGETLNSVAVAIDSYGYGGARRQSVGASQWLKYITLDEMLACGLPAPTHLKIDVDGLEDKVLAGGDGVLSNPALRQAAIEVNGPTRQKVEQTMNAKGFRLDREFRHGRSETYDLYFSRS